MSQRESGLRSRGSKGSQSESKFEPVGYYRRVGGVAIDEGVQCGGY